MQLPLLLFLLLLSISESFDTDFRQTNPSQTNPPDKPGTSNAVFAPRIVITSALAFLGVVAVGSAAATAYVKSKNRKKLEVTPSDQQDPQNEQETLPEEPQDPIQHHQHQSYI